MQEKTEEFQQLWCSFTRENIINLNLNFRTLTNEGSATSTFVPERAASLPALGGKGVWKNIILELTV